MILLDTNLVVAELDYGAKVSKKSEENLEKLYRLLDVVQVIPFDIECAKIFGTIKSRLRSLGKPTGEVDALIAATAMAHEAILITTNKKHFENIEGLKVEVWPIGKEV
jgi:tRNA(fMet)-specific endonuclease VapC